MRNVLSVVFLSLFYFHRYGLGLGTRRPQRLGRKYHELLDGYAVPWPSTAWTATSIGNNAYEGDLPPYQGTYHNPQWEMLRDRLYLFDPKWGNVDNRRDCP